MHYSNLVLIEPIKIVAADLEKAVAEAMGPTEENGGFYDWYQIGGRWTGLFDGYEADKDPANLDEVGKPVWPTDYKFREGDVIPVSQLKDEHLKLCFRIVLQNWGGPFGGEYYMPWADKEKFMELPKPPLTWLKENYKDHLAVIVDNHS